MAGIFRKAALERLSSPDQLDSMLKVTTPMSWVGIGSAAALAAAVVVWSFVGSIPETVSAPGFFVDSYHTNTLYSTAAGKVKELLVEPGTLVEPGMPILELKHTDGELVSVESDQNGWISETLIKKGSAVTPNAELFRISPVTEQDISLVCYVDFDTAKFIKPGMKALVGSTEAVVTNVDRYIASEQAMAELLGADGRLTEMVVQNGPVTTVTCELCLGEKEECEWISVGDQAEVQIILAEYTPISKVFPMFGGN